MPNVHMHEDWGSVDFLYWTKKASCQHKAPNSTSSRTPYSTVLTCKKSSSQQTSTSNHKSEQSKPAHHMIARLQEKEDLTNRSAKDSNPLWAILFGTCQDPWPKTALIHLPKSKKATPYGPGKHCHVHPLGPPTLGCMHICTWNPILSSFCPSLNYLLFGENRKRFVWTNGALSVIIIHQQWMHHFTDHGRYSSPNYWTVSMV